MCKNPATHKDGSAGIEYWCCYDHCTCMDSYTCKHMHALDYAHVLIGMGSPDHKMYLSEKKLFLYWDHICDLPEKTQGGIEVI